MNTTSKRCTSTRQPCFTPHTCSGATDGCAIQKSAHDRAAQAFCSAEADELITFDSRNYRWLPIEPPRWLLWAGIALGVGFGVLCYYSPNF